MLLRFQSYLCRYFLRKEHKNTIDTAGLELLNVIVSPCMPTSLSEHPYRLQFRSPCRRRRVMKR